MAHDESSHRVPLWGLFLALLALTAAEVGLYETWSRSEAFQEALPKFAMVLLILVFTLPKAAIVLIFFMHLKFERQFIVWLAVAPFLFAALAVFPTLVDALALQDRAYNQAKGLGDFRIMHGHGDEAHDDGHDAHPPGEGEHHEPAPDQPAAPEQSAAPAG